MIKYTTLVCPGAGAETSVYRLRLRPKVSAPAGSGSATLVHRIGRIRFRTKSLRIQNTVCQGANSTVTLYFIPDTDSVLFVSTSFYI
jgi:hypothetical protein